MLLAACEQFLSKNEEQIQQVALETLEGHQRAIMGSMTVEVSHFLKSSIFLTTSYTLLAVQRMTLSRSVLSLILYQFVKTIHSS